MQSFLGYSSTQEQNITMSTTSQIRMNFHDDSIERINKLINIYMTGSYMCMCMTQYFTRDDIALNNIARYFEMGGKIKCYKAKQFMVYMNRRGGRVVFTDIKVPQKTEWNTAQEAFEYLLDYQKMVNKELLELHNIATKNNDYQLCDFLETFFLEDIVKHLEELGWIVTNLKRVGKGVGEFVFDEQYFKDWTKVGHTFKWVTEHIGKLDIKDPILDTVGTLGTLGTLGTRVGNVGGTVFGGVGGTTRIV